MQQEFQEQLLSIVRDESESLIEYWLEYFSDEEKNEQYRYYDDFLGFFEECIATGLNSKSDESQALKHFLIKLQEVIGVDRFFNFQDSVYTCFLKFPILRRLDEVGKLSYTTIQPLTAFFEAMTSSLTLEIINTHKKFQTQSVEELSQREAPISEIWEGIMMVSIVGTLDSDRILKIIDKVLENLEQKTTRYVIVDISAIFDMNSETANQLIKLSNAIHFMGTSPLLTGITKNIAKSLTHLDISLGDVKTFSTTKQALMQVLGNKIG